MSQTLNMLAVDYGASSGRAVVGSYDGNKVALREIHRFQNEPVHIGSGLYWDFPRLFHELKQSIRRFAAETGGSAASLAVDTWGVDFGLLDRDGNLLGNPYHYRDTRTDGIMEQVFQLLPEDRLYALTGIQTMQINTVFQLYSMIRGASPMLAAAESLLFTPDLFQYFLTGEKAAEYSIASTSGLLDPYSKTWSTEVLERLNIPPSLLPPVAFPGAVLGSLDKKVREELLVGDIKVANTASHDTASAVAAVPAESSSYAYISCGTWSLMGVESDTPIINDRARLSFTNEGGAAGKLLFMKNITGLWLLQECKREWDAAGSGLSYGDMQSLAARETPLACFVDPDSDRFMAPGGMAARIQAFCSDTGQRVPHSKAELIRCVVDSLALKYRQTLDELEELMGYRLPVIHMVGGGIQNELLCQLTANATGRPVIAGPVEATSAGNILIQAMAHGEIGTIEEIRQVVRNSFPIVRYEPEHAAHWEEGYERYRAVVQQFAI